MLIDSRLKGVSATSVDSQSSMDLALKEEVTHNVF